MSLLRIDTSVGIDEVFVDRLAEAILYERRYSPGDRCDDGIALCEHADLGRELEREAIAWVVAHSETLPERQLRENVEHAARFAPNSVYLGLIWAAVLGEDLRALPVLNPLLAQVAERPDFYAFCANNAAYLKASSMEAGAEELLADANQKRPERHAICAALATNSSLLPYPSDSSQDAEGAEPAQYTKLETALLDFLCKRLLVLTPGRWLSDYPRSKIAWEKEYGSFFVRATAFEREHAHEQAAQCLEAGRDRLEIKRKTLEDSGESGAEAVVITNLLRRFTREYERLRALADARQEARDLRTAREEREQALRDQAISQEWHRTQGDARRKQFTVQQIAALEMARAAESPGEKFAALRAYANVVAGNEEPESAQQALQEAAREGLESLVADFEGQLEGPALSLADLAHKQSLLEDAGRIHGAFLADEKEERLSPRLACLQWKLDLRRVEAEHAPHVDSAGAGLCTCSRGCIRILREIRQHSVQDLAVARLWESGVTLLRSIVKPFVDCKIQELTIISPGPAGDADDLCSPSLLEDDDGDDPHPSSLLRDVEGAILPSVTGLDYPVRLVAALRRLVEARLEPNTSRLLQKGCLYSVGEHVLAELRPYSPMALNHVEKTVNDMLSTGNAEQDAQRERIWDRLLALVARVLQEYRMPERVQPEDNARDRAVLAMYECAVGIIRLPDGSRARDGNGLLQTAATQLDQWRQLSAPGDADEPSADYRTARAWDEQIDVLRNSLGSAKATQLAKGLLAELRRFGSPGS